VLFLPLTLLSPIWWETDANLRCRTVFCIWSWSTDWSLVEMPCKLCSRSRKHLWDCPSWRPLKFLVLHEFDFTWDLPQIGVFLLFAILRQFEFILQYVASTCIRFGMAFPDLLFVCGLSLLFLYSCNHTAAVVRETAGLCKMGRFGAFLSSTAFAVPNKLFSARRFLQWRVPFTPPYRFYVITSQGFLLSACYSSVDLFLTFS